MTISEKEKTACSFILGWNNTQLPPCGTVNIADWILNHCHFLRMWKHCLFLTIWASNWFQIELSLQIYLREQIMRWQEKLSLYLKSLSHKFTTHAHTYTHREREGKRETHTKYTMAKKIGIRQQRTGRPMREYSAGFISSLLLFLALRRCTTIPQPWGPA